MVKNRINKLTSKTKKWIKQHKMEFILLVVVLALGSFFRLYRIGEYLTFLGDEGRDVIVVRRFLVDLDLILVGPGTSIGNMYLGPLYYYLMAPALLLSGLSPVGPAVMVAFLGIATVFLVWFVAREWFGKFGAFIACFLYAIAPVVIYYSRSSWNPNIMPFFALLSIYGIWRVWSRKEYVWLMVVSIAFAFSLQSHYLGLLLGPVVGLYWLLAFKSEVKLIRKNGVFKNKLVTWSIVSLFAFLFLMSPLVIFDYRHEWRNWQAIKIFFTERQTTVSAKPWTALPKIWPLFEQYTSRIIAGKDEIVGRWVSVLLALSSLLFLAKRKAINSDKYKSFMVVIVWLVAALVGFGVYKQHIYDHYFGLIYPAGFLLIAGLVSEFRHLLGGKGMFLSFLGLTILTFYNIKENPFNYPPNRQLQRSIEVAQKIVDESGGKKLNMAVFAPTNYEGAYQYFLEWWNVPFVMIDPQRVEETVADQLFVICELQEEKCDPTHNSKAEVANFGWSKIEDKWPVAGVTLYKLVHVK